MHLPRISDLFIKLLFGAIIAAPFITSMFIFIFFLQSLYYNIVCLFFVISCNIIVLYTFSVVISVMG